MVFVVKLCLIYIRGGCLKVKMFEICHQILEVIIKTNPVFKCLLPYYIQAKTVHEIGRMSEFVAFIKLRQKEQR